MRTRVASGLVPVVVLGMSFFATPVSAQVAPPSAAPPAPPPPAATTAPLPAPSFASIRVTAVDADKTPGLVVEWDGARVASSDLGRPLPADAGEHTVSASAPGRKPWRITVMIQSAGVTTDVAIPALAPSDASVSPLLVPASPVAAPVAVAAALVPSAPPPAAVSKSGRPSDATPPSGFGVQHVLGLVVGGIGVGFVTVGIIAGLNAKSKRDDAKAHCDGTLCRDKRGLDLTTEAVNDGNLATAGLIGGAIGIAGGLTLWFTAPSLGPSAAPARVGVALNRVVLQGAF